MYRVNDIFYSLQGEGRNTGRAAVFVRFAGCNLRCPFCDTEFESYTEMTADGILQRLRRVVGDAIADNPTPSAPTPIPSLLVVLTGGEPTLQVDEALVNLLHQHGYEVAMESNGTRPAPLKLDWLTVSPKSAPYKVQGDRLPDEIKLVFDENTNPEATIFIDLLLQPPYLYLQPCDTGDARRNAAIIERCVDYIKRHPQWRLSLQTHKLIHIP